MSLLSLLYIHVLFKKIIMYTLFLTHISKFAETLVLPCVLSYIIFKIRFYEKFSCQHFSMKMINSTKYFQVKMSGPFGLDMNLIHRIESQAPVVCKVPKLLEPDIDFMESSPHSDSRSSTQSQSRKDDKFSMPAKIYKSSLSPTKSSEDIWKDENIDRAILGMASLDLTIAITSMTIMEQLLKSPHAARLQPKEDKFISSINMQLKLLQTYSLGSHENQAQVSKGYRTAFMVILTFYDSGLFGQNVGTEALKEHVDQMIGFLAEGKLSQLQEHETYVRVINTIVLKIINNSDHTRIICVLINLLHERSHSPSPTKHEELIMKCLWKIVKTIPDWAGDLDYDKILLEIHNFFKDYPTSWWKKQKKPDTPMRTIKTVLHSMTKVKGSTILSHLSLVHNTNDSELRSYLMRLITTFKPDDKTNVQRGTNNQGQNVQLLKHLSKQLSEIFKKIGTKNQSQEGLQQLYEFKLQYPEVNIQPFLNKSHQFFQDYIEEGLKNIELSRNKQPTNKIENNCKEVPEKNVIDDPTAKQWLERLRALEKQSQNTN